MYVKACIHVRDMNTVSSIEQKKAIEEGRREDHLLTHPSIYLPTYLSTYLPIYLPTYLSTYLPELNSPPLLYSSASTSLYFNPMLTLYTLAQAWISGDTVSVALESDEVSS